MGVPTDQLVLREIMPGDKLTGLSFGAPQNAPLNVFLKKDAIDFHVKNIAKTYVFAEDLKPSQVWAYATIMCSEIKLSGGYSIDDCARANRYSISPAVKLVRLAVDQRKKNLGYGKALLSFAMIVALDKIMPHAGCRFLVVDAKQSALSYYQKMGFTMLDTDENRERKYPVLFLDLHKV